MSKYVAIVSARMPIRAAWKSDSEARYSDPAARASLRARPQKSSS